MRKFANGLAFFVRRVWSGQPHPVAAAAHRTVAAMRPCGAVVDRLESRWLMAAAPIGHVDGITPTGVVYGWAADLDVPNRSIDVHVYVDGRAVAGATAAAPRADVNAVIRIPGNHGYGVQLPAPYLDGKPHVVHVFGIDPQGGHNPLLVGSGTVFANAAPIGHDDGISPAGLMSGWALDPSDPARPIDVHVYVDGRIVGGVTAGEARADVNAVTGYPGHHGFRFQLPAAVLDGQPHVVHAYSIDSQGGINPLLGSSGRTFRSAPPPPVAPPAAAEARVVVPGRKGVQAVLLSRWNDKSVRNMLAVMLAPGAPAEVEVAFVPTYNRNNPYGNAETIANALLAAGKRVTLTAHLGFQTADVNQKRLTEDARAYNTFLAKYATDARVTMKLSVALEDKYSDGEFVRAVEIVARNLDASRSTLNVRRSTLTGKDRPAELRVVNRASKAVRLIVQHEVHGKVGNATGYDAYSNDGNFVFYNGDLNRDGRADENAGSSENAEDEDKDVKYSLPAFSKQLAATGYRRAALLWRPAYNLWTKDQHNRFARYRKLGDPAARTDNDTAPKFDATEQYVLAEFLGVTWPPAR